MRTRTCTSLLATTLLTLLLVAPVPVGAQNFEGVIQQRTVTVGEEGIYQILGDHDYDRWAEEEARIEEIEDPEAYQAAWHDLGRRQARDRLDRLAALSTEELLGRAGGSEVEQTESTIRIKGDLMRVDEPGGDTYQVFDARERIIWAVMPARRQYLRMDLDEMMARVRQQMEAMGIDPDAIEEGEAEAPTVRQLGQRREVQGVDASAWEVTSEDEVLLAWVTEAFPGVQATLALFVESISDLEEEQDPEILLFQHGVPMRVHTMSVTDWGPGSYELEETVSVERKGLDASLFEVPAGFQEASMDTLMDGG